MCPDGGSRDQLRSRMAPLPQPREAWIRPIPLLSHLRPCVRSLAGSRVLWLLVGLRPGRAGELVTFLLGRPEMC